jgi:hypothetical protein
MSCRADFAAENLLGVISLAAIDSETSNNICTGMVFSLMIFFHVMIWMFRGRIIIEKMMIVLIVFDSWSLCLERKFFGKICFGLRLKKYFNIKNHKIIMLMKSHDRLIFIIFEKL